MTNSDLVYTIGDIFEQCLLDNGADKYYIAPYQRGYKWGAKANEPVSVLMDDLIDAYKAFDETKRKGEYYLQYITLKKPEGKKYLEVIDGQQRLTTITILLSVITHLDNSIHNAANFKLDYAVRTNFLNGFIYDSQIEKLLLQNDWQTFIADDSNLNKQDIFYLFEASKNICQRFKEYEGEKKLEMSEIKNFHNYLTNYVKIIVNVVEPHIESEKVFSNLNGNKVPLTETELIKGLLLTKTAREYDEVYQKRHFKEILEMRATMGRQWDAIARWFNREEVTGFFWNQFSTENGMYELLKLIAHKDGYKSGTVTNGKHYPLFNYYQTQIKKPTKSSHYFFEKIKLTSALLNEWYVSKETYNLIGFLFYAKSSKENNRTAFITDLLENLIDKKILLNEYLSKKILRVKIDDETTIEKLSPQFINELQYGENNNLIHDLLLLINVFPEQPVRFLFNKFNKEKWSLEHIFPQTPEDYTKNENEEIVLKKEDVDFINEIWSKKKWDNKYLDTQSEDENNAKRVKNIFARLVIKINNSKQKQRITLKDSEIKIIKIALEQESDLINSIGNMALLTSSDNSSNSNDFFDTKRTNIVRLVSEGSFVPQHTYNVFSKLILPETKSLRAWSKSDIEKHKKYISNQVERIIKKLKLLS